MTGANEPVKKQRREIIDAALKLLNESGFGKIQASEISMPVNMADRLVCRYCKSKTEIQCVAIDKISTEQFGISKQILEAHQDTALEGLMLLLACLTDDYAKQDGANGKLIGEPEKRPSDY
jgi:AcrR family transcriptional regulator